MSEMLFAGLERVKARALFMGERLELRSFEQAQRLAISPLMVTAGASGCAALFRYGVVVLFGLNAVEETSLVEALRPFVIDPYDQAESEDVTLTADRDKAEGAGDDGIVLRDFSLEHLQLVAEVLAKSVVLDYYEAAVAKSFRRIEPLAQALQRTGRPGSKGRELLRHIGDALLIQGRMVGRVEISDKPDLLWNKPEFERLYARLEDEYELSERHLALERKLELISRTAETLLSMLQNKRSLRVEWYITILIVFEIILTLYELFWRGGH